MCACLHKLYRNIFYSARSRHPPTPTPTPLHACYINCHPHFLSQIHATSVYQCWGNSVPQASVDPSPLVEKATAIASSCRQRDIIGYISIDFVTFIHPQTVSWLVNIFCTCPWKNALLFSQKGEIDFVEVSPCLNLRGSSRESGLSYNPDRTHSLTQIS